MRFFQNNITLIVKHNILRSLRYNCPLCGEHFTLYLGLLEWHNFTLAGLQIVCYVLNNLHSVCCCLSGTILRSLCYKLSAMCGTIFALLAVASAAQFYARCATNCPLCVEQFMLCLGLLEWHNFMHIAL